MFNVKDFWDFALKMYEFWEKNLANSTLFWVGFDKPRSSITSPDYTTFYDFFCRFHDGMKSNIKDGYVDPFWYVALKRDVIRWNKTIAPGFIRKHQMTGYDFNEVLNYFAELEAKACFI
ncbi:hypothetical protein NXS15_01330 [Mycoplasma sp. CSL7475-4]|uniref:hypothetical protein n=1 Tax=Mycoplasma sp. CSL7475-4 TaxID=2973942 RepID=UPI00216B5527|nr:hypothetical protein [Mycoplasma sp. CSL7475-4]MCS4536773.1 hypothetical protein [Mycoplasma sp. CSL7475-4]